MYLLYLCDQVLVTWNEWVCEQEVSSVHDTGILVMFAHARRQILIAAPVHVGSHEIKCGFYKSTSPGR